MAQQIGFIGGIGPAGTAVYYRTAVRLFAAAGRPLALTIDHADLGAPMANLEAGRALRQGIDAMAAGVVFSLYQKNTSFERCCQNENRATIT